MSPKPKSRSGYDGRNQTDAANRLRSLMVMYAKADTIIAEHPVHCRIVDQPQTQVPAWTKLDGNAARLISFNKPMLGELHSYEDYVRVTGLNYHELAHVLYTPARRAEDKANISWYSTVRQYRMAAMTLEDQRIESFLVVRAPSTASYFRAVMAGYILNASHPDVRSTAWVLAHGRRYLGTDIRDAIRAEFRGSDALATQMAGIIDEYRGLDLTKPHLLARSELLIQQFAVLLHQLQPKTDLSPHNGADGGCDTTDPQARDQQAAGAYGVKNGQDEPKKKNDKSKKDEEQSKSEDQPGAQGSGAPDDAPAEDQDRSKSGASSDQDPGPSDVDDAADQGEDGPSGASKPGSQTKSEPSDDEAGQGTNSAGEPTDEEPPAEDKTDDGPGAGTPEPDPDQSETDEEPTTEGEGGAKPAEDDDQSDDGTPDAPAESGQEGEDQTEAEQDGGGSGAGRGAGEQDQEPLDLAELAAALLEEALGSESVQTDYTAFRATVERGQIGAPQRIQRSWASGVLPEATQLTRQFITSLERIKVQADPGWNRYQASGRINVQRALQGADLDQLFDTWDEGQSDVADVELVLLADISGSMSRHRARLSGALWTIKRACDRVGIRCTVMAFDDGSPQLVYSGDSMAEPGSYPTFNCTGGTEPRAALVETHAVLKTSRRAKKALVTMTDGDWSSSSHRTSADDIVATLNQMGVITQMIYFDDRKTKTAATIKWHNHTHRALIHALGDMPKVVQGLVTQIMRARPAR